MRKIYIDLEFKCHSTNRDGNLREYEHEFFNTKCDEVIECYRFVPAGETWIRPDGESFEGEMITPWKDISEYEIIQRAHELEMLANAENALAVLLGADQNSFIFEVT